MTKLFTTEQIKRFFNILKKLDRGQCDWYLGWDKLNPDSSPCQQEVFVKRTIGKWFSKKHIVLYNNSRLGITYKQYLSIGSIYFGYGYGDGLRVNVFNYSNPRNYEIITVDHNKALSLEGEWSTDSSEHVKLLEMVIMTNVPDKEYIFNAYDWSKYPKRVKKGVDVDGLMKTTKIFIAKTEYQAYELKKQFEEQSKEHRGQLQIYELIEVREL